MTRSFFDQRRPPTPPIGLPREMLDTPVLDHNHRILLAEPAVRALLESDTTPLPAPIDREQYYGDRHLEYWLSGLADWRRLQALLPLAEGPRRYIDLGGSSGRVARHAARVEGLETWLTDIQINPMDWVQRHATSPIRAFQCRPSPHLPLEDRSFALASAFSVFTHLDTDEVAWLLELRRIIAPGGILLATIFDEYGWGLLSQPEWAWLRDGMATGPDGEALLARVGQPMEAERLVFLNSAEDAYNCNIVHTEGYIRRVWGRFFTVLDYVPGGHVHQTVVVLRRD